MTEPLTPDFEPDLPEPARRFLWAFMNALPFDMDRSPLSFNYLLGRAMALGVAASMEEHEHYFHANHFPGKPYVKPDRAS